MHLRHHSIRRSLLVLLAAAAVPWWAGCSSGDDDAGDGGPAGECAANLLAGDLVISEVLANPDGEDAGGEYFEIFNASSSALDLSGLTLAMSPPDDPADEKTHTMGEVQVEAGDYLVLGAVETEVAPEHVDYGFGNDLGSLRNDGARITLRCGESEVDTAEYPSAASSAGISFGLDGNLAPDHLANDDFANFCPATSEFSPGLFGSPGEANEPCNVVVPGMCNEDGAPRETVPPAVGDLVVSEFLANPDGADTGKEWFEVYVAAGVDLNGVVAGLVEGEPKLSIDSEECVSVSAGNYLLFGGTLDPETNGGLPPVDHQFNFTLKNGTTSTGPGTLYLGIGDVLIDAITYEATVDAKSTALDPGQLDPTANDQLSNWFVCDAPYGTEGNSGTPGADNSNCDDTGGECGAGECLDGDSCRPTVAPVTGDLRITESLSDPALTGNDATQEWFEVEALASFDLNGLELGENIDGEVEETLESDDCLAVTSGTLLVFAHELEDNGGLPRVDQLFGFALNQDNGRIFVGHSGAILDDFAYGATDDAEARALSPDGSQICDAEVEYGDAGNFGSPGEANPESTSECTPK